MTFLTLNEFMNSHALALNEIYPNLLFQHTVKPRYLDRFCDGHIDKKSQKAHAAQIGLYTKLHFQIWCDVCK